MQLRFDDDESKDQDKDKDANASFMNELLKSRTIICSKGVDDKLATAVISQLFVLEQQDSEQPITVIVNSPGGSADSGFAIYDALRFVSCPVRTISMGICASAGVMIFLGGDKGMRLCTPTARFLLHQPSMRSMGQASDLEIMSREVDRLKLQYNEIVAEATGRELKTIENDVNRDFWLPAKEAQKYGLVDKVIVERHELED